MSNFNFSSMHRFHPLKILFFGGVFVAFAAGMSWLVMFLWNAILPETVGVQPLTFWKAAGLLLLCKILFGGFGRGRGGKGRAGWKDSKRGQWKQKWMSMNEDEREEAKARWKEHCKKRSWGKED